MVLALKILGAVAALALGIWLGLPGRYHRDLEEIERTMEQGTGRRRPVKRAFTPTAWVHRMVSPGARRDHERRRGFDLKRPEDR